MLFTIAHALKLEDGTYAVRSPEFPECEGRDAEVERAREQFGAALRQRVLQMIEAGTRPSLYGYDELEARFAARCVMQISASDRAPGSFDRVMPIRVHLPAEPAARLPRTGPDSMPAGAAAVQASAPNLIASAASDTSMADGAKLTPSARLTRIGAQLARRNRECG
jgi:hypothetical protein